MDVHTITCVYIVYKIVWLKSPESLLFKTVFELIIGYEYKCECHLYHSVNIHTIKCIRDPCVLCQQCQHIYH